MCPFCYIGKRKFEAALNLFPHREQVQLVWKSFQLSPDMKTNPSVSIHEYLSAHKGIGLKEAKEMNAHVTEMATQVGLVYNNRYARKYCLEYSYLHRKNIRYEVLQRSLSGV